MFNESKLIIAIRIYFDQEFGKEIRADLRMSDGVIETISWEDKKARKQFESGINGYTLWYDERYKISWNQLINK